MVNLYCRCCDLLEDSFNICFLMVNCMSVVGLALAMVYVRNIIGLQEYILQINIESTCVFACRCFLFSEKSLN